MKLRSVISIFCLSFLFISCKKDSPSENPTVSSDNPAALSAAIKIWHGSRETGSIPQPNGMGPMVEAPESDIIAFGGKFAVVQPAVVAGDVKGYFVQINGAADYFNVDYTRPRETGKNNFLKSKHNLANRKDPPPPNYDSSIVLILPPNIQVPDTFCITYWAYDYNGNVGYPVTSCIIVTQLGGSANSSWLQGAWRITGTKDSISQTSYDTVLFNRWYTNQYSNEYYCINDGSSNYISTYCDPNYICTPLNIQDSTYTIKSDFLLNNNGGMKYYFHEKNKYVDVALSSGCSAMMTAEEEYNDEITGGWSLNGNVLTLVWEFNIDGLPQYDSWQYTLNQLDNNSFTLTDTYDPFYIYTILFRKL